MKFMFIPSGRDMFLPTLSVYETEKGADNSVLKHKILTFAGYEEKSQKLSNDMSYSTRLIFECDGEKYYYEIKNTRPDEICEKNPRAYINGLPHLSNPHKIKNLKNYSNMEAKVLSEAKVYVGTYAKYNNGSLSGAWLDLSDYSDKEEFYEACRELHKDEEDAEYMFQDWENVPEGLIGESWISENFFALRDAVEDLSDTEQEAFFVWCNYKSHDLGEEDADDLVRDFRDEYLGQYDDEEDFAYEIIEECYDLPEFAKTYFDYEKFARDLFMCDYWFDDGFVFRAA